MGQEERETPPGKKSQRWAGNTAPELINAIEASEDLETRLERLGEGGPEDVEELIRVAQAHGSDKALSAAVVRSLKRVAQRHPQAAEDIVRRLPELTSEVNAPGTRLVALEAMNAIGVPSGTLDERLVVDIAFACLDAEAQARDGNRASLYLKRVRALLRRLAGQSEAVFRLFAERVVGRELFELPLGELVAAGGKAYPHLQKVAVAERRENARLFLLDKLWDVEDVDSEGVPPIFCAVLLDDDREEVLYKALKGLLRYLKNNSISKKLVDIILNQNFKSETVRFAAAAHVHRLSPMESIPALVAIARTDSDTGRRGQAKAALESLATEGVDGPVKDAATDALTRLAREEETTRAASAELPGEEITGRELVFLGWVVDAVRAFVRRYPDGAASLRERCLEAIEAERPPNAERTLGVREASRYIKQTHNLIMRKHYDGVIGGKDSKGHPIFSEKELKEFDWTPQKRGPKPKSVHPEGQNGMS